MSRSISNQKSQISKRKGFTLIELLIVMAIMTTLTTLIFVSLDPITRFAQARNSSRQTDINSILTAIHEYIIDNNGSLPAGLTTTEKQLGTCISGGAALCSTAVAACLDLSATLARYLKSIPFDSGKGSAATTAYSVVIDSNNIVTVKACQTEIVGSQTTIITVSR